MEAIDYFVWAGKPGALLSEFRTPQFVTMFKNHSVIDIDPGRRPYNAYLVLPFDLLRKLSPLLKNEILKGLVDSDEGDRVILHLNLETDKIKKLKKVAASLKDRSFVFKK